MRSLRVYDVWRVYANGDFRVGRLFCQRHGQPGNWSQRIELAWDAPGAQSFTASLTEPQARELRDYLDSVLEEPCEESTNDGGSPAQRVSSLPTSAERQSRPSERR